VATRHNHRVPARARLPGHPPAASHATGTGDLPASGRSPVRVAWPAT